MQRDIPSTARSLYGSFVSGALAKSPITEDRHLSRKRALETLDTALLEYMSYSMPSGFKDWTPDIENIKKLEPEQRMLGFMSYTQRPLSSSEVPYWRRARASSPGDDEDEEDGELSRTACWNPTSLLRLARLGLVTPMAASSGLQKHNMRCVFAGLIDGFVRPVKPNDKFAICSFKLPDWRRVLAEDYSANLNGLVSRHNMLLQDMCYDKTAPEQSSLSTRIDALKTFLRGSLSWMLLDLPLGGGDTAEVYKFDYAFSYQLRRAMVHIENLINGSAAVVEYKKHGHSSWYGKAEICHTKHIVPYAYSGLHGHLDSRYYPGRHTLTCESADLRRAVLLSLLYPGLLADHGIVAAYVMAKSRVSNNSGVADLKNLQIREVDRSMQETVWVNEVTMNVNPLIIPNAINGTLEAFDRDQAGMKQVPIDLLTPSLVDHQDVVDTSFGAGYVRMSSSKRIGELVREAIREVLYASGVEHLGEVYNKYRDALNEVCPLSEHKPGSGDKVSNAFKHQQTISLNSPASEDISNTLELKHENLTASE